MRTITIDNKYVTKNGPYPKILSNLKIHNNRNNNIFNWTDIRKDFKIVYCKHYNKFYNKFYIHAPILIKIKSRSFLSYYLHNFMCIC